MDNAALASALDAWAAHIEGRGASRFRVNAYKRGAAAVRNLPDPVEAWLASGRDLTRVPDIGPSVLSAIRTILATPELNPDATRTALEQKWEREKVRREDTDTVAPDEHDHHRPKRAAAPDGQARPALAKRLKGDLHVHTDATDGAHSIQQMVDAAKRRGYAYVAITDHSRSTTVAGGLSEERMRKHVAAIRRVAEAAEGIAVLAGAEVDILRDGKLDFSDALLAELDVVVCSVHARHGLTGKQQTERILSAMANDHADILGHPTGRRTGVRDAMALDLPRLVDAAAGQGWCIEMNGCSERLDLGAAEARAAAKAGVPLALDSDAHATWELGQVDNAAREAEKAGLAAGQVLNCLPLAKLRKRLA